jgi:hypothetical protein
LLPQFTLQHFASRPYGPAGKAISLLLHGLFFLNFAGRGPQIFALSRRGHDSV